MSKSKHEESFRLYMHERIKKNWLKAGHSEEVAENTAKYAMETCVYPSELRTWCDAKEESASNLTLIRPKGDSKMSLQICDSKGRCYSEEEITAIRNEIESRSAVPECFCIEHGLHIQELQKKLAEAQALVRKFLDGKTSVRELVGECEAFLSATAQPEGCPSCKGTGEGIDMGDCVLVSCMCNGTGKLPVKDKS